MKIINRNLFVLLTALLLTSCIERYLPVTELDFKPRLVIDGNISTDGSDQEIVISESSQTEKPVFVAVSGCKVSVEDNKGNSFLFNESNNKGHYVGKIDGSLLVIGEKYRLHVKTSMGTEYISSYEELTPCPEVDRVYYEVQTKQTENPDITENGLQFYIDFKGDANSGHFYRLQLTQTYEYHSKWPLDKWLGKDGFHDLVDPDYSNFVCYRTDKLKSIYVLSTDGFSQNKFSKYKLHFVEDQTEVLMYKYSLLVNQYSLTKRAYNYWENLRKNNQETVDLFGKQPANVKGNISNVSDTTDVALGYFTISSVQSKRIMVTPVEGLYFNHFLRCQADIIDGPLPAERPLYYVTDYDANGNIYTGLGAPSCIDCTLVGGTTVKPPYWDEK
ncbi:hypothetical protein AQPE_1679 [Aquipluma nitroreducens]|uniref:DUF4249 domain-containing protein n=1 Tax=Aquipluma nitroreducens TaxID=2010828 RepID=A0A5K7S7I3_9BACT|nr:DUF4249 domain-containing protein [Aquipluma nitroreducens]BBE17528.1 hypothetical protein AQPE_1679 [Aquipluma nitroreducens]